MAVEHKSPTVKAKATEVQRSAKGSSGQGSQSQAALPSPRSVLQRAKEDPTSLTPAEVEVLQRTVGPHAVQRMLGAQAHPLQPTVQPKLSVGPVGDTYEQEADRVAKQVMNSPASAQRQPTQIAEDEVQRTSAIQRVPVVQRASADGFEVGSDFEHQLNRSKGGGAPLPGGLRSGFEQKFGAEFGGVRVHTGAKSDQLSRSIQAKAFTTGQDLFFRQGAYAPGSRSGQELIAHELTHVVQQNGDRVRRKEAGNRAGQASGNDLSISSMANDRVQRRFGFEIELQMLFTSLGDQKIDTSAGQVEVKEIPVDAGFGGDTKLVDLTGEYEFYLNPDHNQTMDALYKLDLMKYWENKGYDDEVKAELFANMDQYMPHHASIVEVVTEPWDENTLTRPQALAKVRSVVQGVNAMYDQITNNQKYQLGNYFIGSDAQNADVFQPRIGYFHSTYGIKLAQVPRLFEKTTKQKKKLRKYVDERNKPQAEHAKNLELTSNSVSLAKTAMKSIKPLWPTVAVQRTILKDTTKIDMPEAAQKDFLGGLTLLINYFLLMNANTSGGDLAKKLVGMHYYKSDLYDVFDSLDAKVKTPLRAGNTALVDGVIAVICQAVGVAETDTLNNRLGRLTVKEYLYQIFRGTRGTIKEADNVTEKKDPDDNTFMDPVLAKSINPYSKKLGPENLTGGGKIGKGVVMENRHLEYMDPRYGDLLDSAEADRKSESAQYAEPKVGGDTRTADQKAMYDSVGAREEGPAKRPIAEWEGMMMNIYDMVKGINKK